MMRKNQLSNDSTAHRYHTQTLKIFDHIVDGSSAVKLDECGTKRLMVVVTGSAICKVEKKAVLSACHKISPRTAMRKHAFVLCSDML